MAQKINMLLIFLLFPVMLWAECNQPVTFVVEGDPAPCDGYHFTREAEAQAYLITERNKIYPELLKEKDKYIGLLKTERDMYQEGISELQKTLERKEKFDTLKNAGYFVLGAGLTAVIAYGVLHSLK
jgi:hypothetical protein